MTIEHLACFLDMLRVSLWFKLTLNLVQLSSLIPWCPSSKLIDLSMCAHSLPPWWSNYYLTLTPILLPPLEAIWGGLILLVGFSGILDNFFFLEFLEPLRSSCFERGHVHHGHFWGFLCYLIEFISFHLFFTFTLFHCSCSLHS